MDTQNFQGPVTTASNPSRLVPLGGSKKRSMVRKAVKDVITKRNGQGGCGKK